MSSPRYQTKTRVAIAAAVVATIGAAFGPGLVRSYGPWADHAEPPAVSRTVVGDPSTTAAHVADLERRAEGSDDPAAHLALAGAYLQRVRETSDPSLYPLAEQAINHAEDLAPGDPEVAFARGTLALSRHDFEQALALGQQALAIDPDRANYYGLVADAQIELGRYEEAVASLQAMVDRRPDFASYSRISYVRELYGDLEGAIEAMEAAIAAGAAYPENVAWARVQAGNLRFALGDSAGAQADYEAALRDFDGYAGALAGQARVAAARGDFPRAADLYQQAFDHQPSAEYAIALGDIARRTGDEAAAAHADGLVEAILRLAEDNGVDTDLEVAVFLADRGSIDEALARAERAYARGGNVYATDALAWALYRAGDLDAAYEKSREALRIGSRDHLMLFHAGVIASAAGKPAEAREHLQLVLNLQPSFSILHAEEAMRLLASL